MPRLSETKQLDSPPHVVFAAIHCYGRRLEWDTLLRRVEIMSEDGESLPRSTPLQAGMVVRSYARWLSAGVVMETRYTACEFPRATIEMVAGPWFFKSFEATAVLEASEAGGTVWHGQYEFECQPSLLNWIIEPIVTWMFRRETRLRVAGLKQWLQNR